MLIHADHHMPWRRMPPALKFLAIKVAWTSRATQRMLARKLGTTPGAIASMYRRHPSLKVTHALNGRRGRPRLPGKESLPQLGKDASDNQAVSPPP